MKKSDEMKNRIAALILEMQTVEMEERKLQEEIEKAVKDGKKVVIVPENIFYVGMKDIQTEADKQKTLDLPTITISTRKDIQDNMNAIMQQIERNQGILQGFNIELAFKEHPYVDEDKRMVIQVRMLKLLGANIVYSAPKKLVDLHVETKEIRMIKWAKLDGKVINEQGSKLEVKENCIKAVVGKSTVVICENIQKSSDKEIIDAFKKVGLNIVLEKSKDENYSFTVFGILDNGKVVYTKDAK
jgi:hypothetical protein